MNARGGRSNAMVKFLVSVAAACVWNACTRPIAAVVASRTPSEQIYAPVKQMLLLMRAVENFAQ